MYTGVHTRISVQPYEIAAKKVYVISYPGGLYIQAPERAAPMCKWRLRVHSAASCATRRTSAHFGSTVLCMAVHSRVEAVCS